MQLKQHRHQGFVGFAFEGAFGGEVKVFDQLLGQGGATLALATGCGADQGACCTANRNAIVLIKLSVFGSDQRVNQRLRDLCELYQDPIFIVAWINPTNHNWVLDVPCQYHFAWYFGYQRFDRPEIRF